MNLSPEQKRALAVFMECYLSFNSNSVIPSGQLSLNSLTVSGTHCFVKGPVNRKIIPHESYWIWNQSKCRVHKKLQEGLEIHFAKLNPRRVNRDSTKKGLPSYKLWIFEVKSVVHYESLHFCWCEKGKSSLNAIPPFVREKNKLDDCDEISVDQLSFLVDFVDKEVAFQLGWLKTPSWTIHFEEQIYNSAILKY